MLTRQVLCQFPWGRSKAACTPPFGVWADRGNNGTQNNGTHNSDAYRSGIGRATHDLLLKLATKGGKLVFFIATVQATIIQWMGIQWMGQLTGQLVPLQSAPMHHAQWHTSNDWAGNDWAGNDWAGNDWAGGTQA
jgi:hypothetical protein